jgi:pimeloyl-ACP methyl ester carboxylesterase
VHRNDRYDSEVIRETTIATPRGTFAALETDGEHPLVFLHGFPDHPPTARAFIGELAARGFRVLAPWLRGYAPSPLHGSFDLRSLADDIVAIGDRWSPSQPFDLVGHDWGAMITYFACARRAAAIRRAVTVAVPHPRTFVRQLRRPAQLAASWYTALFQLPGAPHLARRDDFALVDRLWRTWSPGFHLPASDRAALHATLAASFPAPIEYYRSARRSARDLLADRLVITTPLFALHGEADGCVLPPEVDDSYLFAGPYERETLPGLGHFLHLEAPSRVAGRVEGWLA